MRSQADIWDEYYRSGNPSWKGSPFPLPNLPKGSRILEVGCGQGSTMIQAAEMGYVLTGIDISPAAVCLAEKRLSRRGIKADLQVGDITNYRSDSSRFGGILLHHVLSSLMEIDRRKAVSRVVDLLDPGGIVSFQDFSDEDMRYGRGSVVEVGTFRKGSGLICHFFGQDEVIELFSDLGKVELEIGRWPQKTAEGMQERVRICGIFKLM